MARSEDPLPAPSELPGPAARRAAAVLWTGGKDSALALHIAARPARVRIDRLVTFVPPRARFRAHPLAVMRLQAQALALPHQTIVIRKPYRASYERALGQLQAEGIETLVTGDIDQVGGAPNWIAERARPFNLEIFAPLWQRSRTGILRALIRSRFEAIVSCVDHSKLGPEWLGRRLDLEALRDLRGLSRSTGIDPAGEQGEYHTITLDAPMFRKRLVVRSWTPSRSGPWSYMRIRELALVDRHSPGPGRARLRV